MGALAVVTINPAADSDPCLASCFECVEIDAFVFERPPESLDHDVVHPAPFAVHRDFDVGILQYAGERIAGKLAALIGVEDFRLAETAERLLQRLNAELRMHRVRQAPAQHFPRRPVHDRDEI